MKKAVAKLENLLEAGGTKKDIILLVISGIALGLSLCRLPLPFNPAWIAIILCGIPIILEALIGLITAFDIKADVLVSMALIASVLIGEDFAAGEVAFIMQLGALLETLTVAKARAGIEKLVNLTPQTARVLSDGKEKMIPAMQVQVGDLLRVLPGETVPVDGIIVNGQTSISQAVMTGESLPVDKEPGDEVSSGTVNQYGAFEMKAVKVGEDSSIQRMVRLVQTADAGKAKIVGIADHWATWIVVIALSAAILTWIFSGKIIRAVTILVVFCPCALVLATPAAIMAGIGNATKHGFLVRQGDALERLSKASKVIFDKTGTLTYGTPEVTQVYSASEKYTEDTFLQLVASVEQYSEHPLGKAIVTKYKDTKQHQILPAQNFEMIPGEGVSANISGNLVLAGNLRLLEKHGIALTEEERKQADKLLSNGATIVYVVMNGSFAGFVALADKMRKEAWYMIRQMKRLGVEPVLATGDHESAARNVANELGIENVVAQCLPEDKLNLIDQYQKQGKAVCMIGDGINDAPALKKADTGIAMGGIGSDIAVDAADIVLVDDEVREMPHLLALSRRMMRVIRFNLSFSMGLNFLAIILAITGVLNPVIGALVHNAGSVFVIIHSALLLNWKIK